VVRRFPYREEGSPPTARPTLDVRLSLAPNGEWTTRALVDTGSPITIFDRGTADALGVRIARAGADTASVALLGKLHTAQFEFVDLALAVDLSVSWLARVAFIRDPTFEMPFQGILGTVGFLDRWTVTFDKYHDYFSIREPTEDD